MDSLQLDSSLLTAMQKNPQYDYDRELIGGGENLLEWMRRVIIEWVNEYLGMVLDDDIANYILIGIGVVVVLFLALLYWRLRPKLFVRGGNGDEMAYDVQEDTIYGVDFDAEIAKAQQAGDYRQGVRLVYLQTLWQLQNAERIEWQPSKTPEQYLRQVKNQDFTAMSHIFIRVRYGNFEATKELFDEMQTLQSSLITHHSSLNTPHD